MPYIHLIFTLSAITPFVKVASSDVWPNFAFPFDASSPQKFDIQVNQDFLKETTQKVNLYRPERAFQDVADWEDGPPPQAVEDLAAYWSQKYDWSLVQGQINNNFSHYAVNVPGTRNYTHPISVHFIHERSSVDDAIPLLLLHGWPSTSLGYSEVIKPLAHPSASAERTPSFHVVVPDLPGFGFSPAASYPGLGPREMGDSFNTLMHQLGYKRYMVQSTDLGWFVGSFMTEVARDSVVAHSTDFWFAPPDATDLERYANHTTSPEENISIEATQAFQAEDFGYANIHSTRPLQLAHGMTDSPVGWAAWIWQLIKALNDGYDYSYEYIISTAYTLWLQGAYANIRTYKEFLKVWYPLDLGYYIADFGCVA